MKILNEYTNQGFYEFRKGEILHIHYDEDELEETVRDYIVDYFDMSDKEKQWIYPVKELYKKFGIDKNNVLIDTHLMSYENKSEPCPLCDRLLENIITRRSQLLNGFKSTTKSAILDREIVDANGNQLQIGELYCIDCGFHKSDLIELYVEKKSNVDIPDVEYILLDSRNILEKVKHQKELNEHEYNFLEKTLKSNLMK